MIHITLELTDGLRKKTQRMTGILNNHVTRAIVRWHDKTLPKHFKKGAESKYDYAPRTDIYLKRKARQKPAAGPLMFSGESRRKLRRAGFFSVAVRQGAVIGKFIVGSDINYFYTAAAKQPNKAKELTAVTREETGQMAAFVLKSAAKELNALKTTKRKIR